VAYAYSESQGAPDIFADDPQCRMSCPEETALSAPLKNKKKN